MEEQLKRDLIVLASIGSSMGVVGGVIVTAVISTNLMADGRLYLCSQYLLKSTGGNELKAFLIQVVLMALYGAVCMGGVVVYEIEHWSLLRSTLTHFMLTMLSFFVTAFTLGWLKIGLNRFNLIFLAALIMVYVIIWLINYLSYRSQIRKMNRELEMIKSTKHSD